MKTSFKQAYGSALSYFLANLGMIIVVSILALLIAAPLAIVAWVALSPISEVTMVAMGEWAVANPLVLGGIGILLLIPFISLFLVVSGSIYGMSHDLVTTGETKAEAAFSYLRRKFLTLWGTGAILTIIILLPPALVWGLTAYAMGFTTTAALSTLLTVFTFVWLFITIGLTAMVFPAVVSGKGVQQAFKESFSLATKYFDRIYGVLAAIVLLIAATFGPIIIAGLTIPLFFQPGIPMMSFGLFPALAGIMLWTVVSVFLWLFLFLPMIRITWVRVYQELTGGTIASQTPVVVPIV